MSEKVANKEWEPKIVAIVCNWCTYAGADLVGISRIQYPPNVRILRVPCTGRINPGSVLGPNQSRIRAGAGKQAGQEALENIRFTPR